ncbi:putative enzymatic polyprotein-like [Capsicum annuum]|nr:putative enzymatic polyprotein-like [Capsicum annuum]
MGNHVKKFGRIFDYRDEILRSNPGTTCVVKVDYSDDSGKLVFQSFYICFDPCKKAFLNGCRRCIGLDGCFLKGVTKRQLLVAVAKDGNNQMLPVAWAVVQYENKNIWIWFVKLLIEDLGLTDDRDYTIISDMQKGIRATLIELLPKVEHRMCARHILANWGKKWRGLQRKNQFWKCARSTFKAELKKNLNQLAMLGGEDIVPDLLHYKGIPCPHGIAAILYKKLDPIDFVDSCYSKETYLKTYYHYILPVTNMNMWPESTNPHVEPPVVVFMPGRPKKKRNKQFYETKKCGKISRKGVYMTCRICHGQNHNKRGCPFKEKAKKISDNFDAPPRPRRRPRNTTPATLAGQTAPTANIKHVAEATRERRRGVKHVEHVAATTRGRERGIEHVAATEKGRVKSVEYAIAAVRGREMSVEHAAAAARGRERGVEHVEHVVAAARGREMGVEHAAAAARGREKGVEHVAAAAVAGRGRERPRKTPLGDIGVAKRTPLHEWFEHQTIYALPNPPASPVYAPPNSFASPIHTPPNPHVSTSKRPKTVEIGVLIIENGFTTYNPRLPSSRILHTGSAHPIRSADINGDLGYKPKIRVR